jgi:hypothetical protein
MKFQMKVPLKCNIESDTEVFYSLSNTQNNIEQHIVFKNGENSLSITVEQFDFIRGKIFDFFENYDELEQIFKVFDVEFHLDLEHSLINFNKTFLFVYEMSFSDFVNICDAYNEIEFNKV